MSFHFSMRFLWYPLVALACCASMLVGQLQPAAASMQMGKFSINFELGDFRRNGDFVIPGQVTGVSPDGDFRSDRAIGNYQRGQVTLIGHVVLHERFSGTKGPPQPPMTLTAEQLHIDSKLKLYTATGNVRAVQGTRTLTADLAQLNDATHDTTFTGNVHLQDSGRALDAQEIHYNLASGDLQVPVRVSGHSADGDFSADRASGNQRTGIFTLSGNVLVHKLGGVGKGAQSRDPVTLQSERLVINNQTKEYDADGHVRVSQANRIISAPHLTLNDTTHVATMTGGVHGQELPDRTFDAAQLIYNTQTEDFKALGGVRVTFPYRRGGASPTPSPRVTPITR